MAVLDKVSSMLFVLLCTCVAGTFGGFTNRGYLTTPRGQDVQCSHITVNNGYLPSATVHAGSITTERMAICNPGFIAHRMFSCNLAGRWSHVKTDAYEDSVFYYWGRDRFIEKTACRTPESVHCTLSLDQEHRFIYDHVTGQCKCKPQYFHLNGQCLDLCIGGRRHHGSCQCHSGFSGTHCNKVSCFNQTVIILPGSSDGKTVADANQECSNMQIDNTAWTLISNDFSDCTNVRRWQIGILAQPTLSECSNKQVWTDKVARSKDLTFTQPFFCMKANHICPIHNEPFVVIRFQETKVNWWGSTWVCTARHMEMRWTPISYCASQIYPSTLAWFGDKTASGEYIINNHTLNQKQEVKWGHYVTHFILCQSKLKRPWCDKL